MDSALVGGIASVRGKPPPAQPPDEALSCKHFLNFSKTYCQMRNYAV